VVDDAEGATVEEIDRQSHSAKSPDARPSTHLRIRPDPAVLLRDDRCALLQGKRDGALGEDKEGTSPSVLSDLPA
jgi:hypothetical protein